jgi:hypothetical protein
MTLSARVSRVLFPKRSISLAYVFSDQFCACFHEGLSPAEGQDFGMTVDF